MNIYLPLTPFQLLQAVTLENNAKNDTIIIILRTCVSLYEKLKMKDKYKNIDFLIFSEESTDLKVTSRINYMKIRKFSLDMKKKFGSDNHIITGSDDNFFVKILYNHIGREVSLLEDGTGSFTKEFLSIRKKINIFIDRFIFGSNLGISGLGSSQAKKYFYVNKEAFKYILGQEKKINIAKKFVSVCREIGATANLCIEGDTLLVLPPWDLSKPHDLKLEILGKNKNIVVVKFHPRETSVGVNNWKNFLTRHENLTYLDSYQFPLELYVSQDTVKTVISLETSTTRNTTYLFEKEFLPLC